MEFFLFFLQLEMSSKIRAVHLETLMLKNSFQELNESEVKLLHEYCTVLEPIAIAIDKLQGEQLSFYGYAIPVLRQTEALLNKPLKHNALLVQNALRGMQEKILAVSSARFYVGKRCPFSHSITSFFQVETYFERKNRQTQARTD